MCLGPWWWLVLGGALLVVLCKSTGGIGHLWRLSLFLFQKATEKSKSPHGSKKKCPSCRVSMGESWTKALCKECIDGLVREQAAEQGTDLAASVKELSSTFQSFKALFSSFQLPQAQSSPLPVQQSVTPSPVDTPSVSGERPGGSRVEIEEEPDSTASDSQRESDVEEVDGESTKTSRYKLSLDEVEELLGAIHTTLGIQEEKKVLSLHDQMYKGLGEQKKEGFPSP